MKALKITTIVLYLFPTVVMGLLGSKFITATEYFSYHAQATGVEWSAIDPGLQLVYLAVFKLCGAALLSLCISMSAMIAIPFAKRCHRWSYFAIPAAALLFWSIALGITLHVTNATPAVAPWGGSLSCVVSILAGFAVSLVDLSRRRFSG